MNLKGIKNIIFDLGGVIINLDFQLSFEAFAKICDKDVSSLHKVFKELQTFEKYNDGSIDDDEFRAIIKREFNAQLTDEMIDKAWNALLLDIPEERLALLKVLKNKYRTFLLSNTNEIHLLEVNKILSDTSGIKSFDQLFEKVYYSHKLKLAKPGLEVYNYVLKKNNLIPEETLFIDDLLENIEGAQKAGLKTIHVQPPFSIIELLKHA